MTAFRLTTCLAAVMGLMCAGAQEPIRPLKVHEVASQDPYEHADALVDGDPSTCFFVKRIEGAAGDISPAVTLNLGGAYVVEAVRVANGDTPVRWVTEIEVSADAEHFRPLLGRAINLPMWKPRGVQVIPAPPSVARYVRVSFGGVRAGRVGEVECIGRPNRLERHMLCWSGSIEQDYLAKIDYISKDLCATDLWIDAVETGFPQSVGNSGFALWEESGALKKLAERGIRYWLCEHESFGFLVNAPEDLRDDRRWLTTLREMRRVYSRARELGFRGIVFDAEDYNGAAPHAVEAYKEQADHVDCWCFSDEFEYEGLYYQRGLQVGKAIAEAWPDAPLIQLYEARMYAGMPGCRDGNYWWLLGIHDAGVEIWIATEKTYGAGKGELAADGVPPHLTRWFVRMPAFVPKVHDAFPFAARVISGFHPWNARLKRPMYLPKYLAEQLTDTEGCTRGCWIYIEGNPHAGDPRDVLDADICASHGVSAEDYLAVLRCSGVASVAD